MLVDAALRHSRLFKSVDRTLPADTLQASWSEEPLMRWNRIARAALASARSDAVVEVRVLAVLNLALSDAIDRSAALARYAGHLAVRRAGLFGRAPHA